MQEGFAAGESCYRWVLWMHCCSVSCLTSCSALTTSREEVESSPLVGSSCATSPAFSVYVEGTQTI